jgi:hypothetical protein
MAAAMEINEDAFRKRLSRKRPTRPPQRTAISRIVFVRRSGSSESIWLFEQVGGFSRVSRNHRAGSGVGVPALTGKPCHDTGSASAG